MTPECKRIKLTSLVSLAVGVVEIVSGFVMSPPFGISIVVMFIPLVAGIIALVMGVHGARAANVPAKAAKLMPFAALMCVLACACVGVAVYLCHGFSPVVGVLAVPVVLDVAILVFASQAKKAYERA